MKLSTAAPAILPVLFAIVTTTLLLPSSCYVVNAHEGERHFVDDSNVIHHTAKEKPTIVTFAHTAASLFSYGLTTDQLLGTYGEYVVTGSDYDFDEPEQASTYNADPEPDDITKLQKVQNLSPDCERIPGYCTSFDTELLLELNPDYLIVHGYADKPWAFSNFTEQVLSQIVPNTTQIIYNDVSLRGDDCFDHENCYGLSMIDMIEKYKELALFLNIDPPEQLQQDYVDLCTAATTFSDHMKTAHEKGIRTMASYVDPSTAFYASPVDDIVLRMFEELGMPILHIGSCDDCSLNYFWESIPTESYFVSCTEEQTNATDFESCNTNPLYPVDVWLYDHRTRGTIQNEDFAVVFPDLAIQQKQYVEWPIGGRKLTPRHAIEILNSVGPFVAEANRIHDNTDCVGGIDVSGMEHRQSGKNSTKGAGAGEYACYNTDYHNPKYLQGCSSSSGASGSSSTDEDAEDSSDSSSSKTPESGACYDMTVHECSCDPGSCNAELCKSQDGIWTADCPNHCDASLCGQSSAAADGGGGSGMKPSDLFLFFDDTEDDPVVESLAESSSAVASIKKQLSLVKIFSVAAVVVAANI